MIGYRESTYFNSQTDWAFGYPSPVVLTIQGQNQEAKFVDYNTASSINTVENWRAAKECHHHHYKKRKTLNFKIFLYRAASKATSDPKGRRSGRVVWGTAAEKENKRKAIDPKFVPRIGYIT